MTTAQQIQAAYPKAGIGLAHGIVALGRQIGADPAWIANVINAESAFNPQARNPRSGATGLIQFMPKTAEGLGTSTEALAKMNAGQQFAFVAEYLRRFKGRLRAQSDVVMAVFYPAAIGKPDDWAFPAKVVEQNPTLPTVGAVVAQVLRNSRLPTTGGAAPPALPGPVDPGALVPAPPAKPRKRPKPKRPRWTFNQKLILGGAAALGFVSLAIVIAKISRKV